MSEFKTVITDNPVFGLCRISQRDDKFIVESAQHVQWEAKATLSNGELKRFLGMSNQVFTLKEEEVFPPLSEKVADAIVQAAERGEFIRSTQEAPPLRATSVAFPTIVNTPVQKMIPLPFPEDDEQAPIKRRRRKKKRGPSPQEVFERIGIGQRVKSLREGAGDSQRALASVLCVDQVIISRLERGAMPPRHETVRDIAEFYGKPFAWVMGTEAPTAPGASTP